MIEPENKEEADADRDERLEEAKKTVDSFALTVIALGSGGVLFWVVNLAYTRWNIDPGQDLLLAVLYIACQPMLCLIVHRSTARSGYVEQALKACAYLALGTAVACVGGLQAVHVARHGWSHWGCLGAGQKWQDMHPEIHGTVTAFRCGAEECTREQAQGHEAPRMMVEFDRRAWYEARPGPAEADCRTVAFSLKPGAWLPNLGGRVAAANDICQSILPRADATWHPIR